MSTRDKLTLELYKAMDAAWSDETEFDGAPVKIADHLLSQGWRPPMRTVTTVEELEALPGKTVIEDGDGDPWIKAEAPLMDLWMYAGLEYSSENMFWGIRCPFRVVWEPEEKE